MNSSENKNLILAMTLMLAVWLGFSLLFPPDRQEQQTPPATENTKQVENTAVDNVPQVVKTEPVTPENSIPETPPVPLDETSGDARRITVETDKYQAVFTSQGAQLLSFKLKEYRATADPDAPPVEMHKAESLRYATLRTTASAGFDLDTNTLFETSAEDILVVTGSEQSELRFRHVAANGMEYVKVFHLQGDRYTIETQLQLNNSGATPQQGTIDFALVQRWDEELKPDRYSFAGPTSMVNNEIKEIDVDDLQEGSVVYNQGVAWTSFQTKYFLSVVVPDAQTAARVEILRKEDAIENLLETPVFSLAPGEQRQLDYLVYIGPKDPEQLKAAGHNLEKVIHFGFFDLLAQPLFTVLTFFYGYFKNYGVAIILLTVLIKILFWPLTHKSYSSMKAMQKLQPEMQKLREKYSNDKERLNKEMMALYKTHRVNPLGGCLPMLIQIPVFFALYKVLLGSIALRHAPFALWITDLSAKDPYYITPLLMGASMFVQQKMTPTTADPMQAKIFMMMPVIFTFLFLNFPSGLVIYWLVNNLLTIVQQYFIHRKNT
jgi:YidC/Oxa1 family membrane protein insertase